MKQRYYTGVGSRKTPLKICKRMTVLSIEMSKLGYKLRTGDADGADLAFRWPLAPWERIIYRKGTQTPKSVEMMLRLHPAPENAKRYVAYLGRNPLQVLGDKLDDPSDFLVCWTPRGSVIGGTGLTIRVAHEYNVPVFNLAKCTIQDVIRYAKELMENGKNGP
jgi:hypothetical protein